ncbi:MAG: DUF438 domain-containing protein [Deltaproteobacteria bacterium]|nr:DUF438 domain-containing protein [Deltaproteobacteria bacterium]
MSEIIDNRAHRVRLLKGIIKDLHRGVSPEEVKGRLSELVKVADASEVAEMEQELMAEGMALEEVQAMCDLHAQVLGDVLAPPPPRRVPPGHPIDTFVLENQALADATARMRETLAALKAHSGETVPDDDLDRAREGVNALMDVDKHYQRKENLLFPCLERHGVTGPSKVMWGKDDEVRELLKALRESLAVRDASAGELQVVIDAVAEPALQAIEAMIAKEDKVLLPMAQELLSDDEWAEIWVQSPEYGWCLVEPRTGYQPPAAAKPSRTASIAGDEAVAFPTGALTFVQLRGLLGALPVDLTFVDADDRVCFFSEGPSRIFARSKAILGRTVQNCHPPKSVSTVERILADFKAGRQSVAEFWIELGGKFVHIRYFAMRGEAGEYLGTLEVTQDLTPLRALSGERRLLAYDAQQGAGAR